MIFSVADIPVQASDPFGEIVEDLRKMERPNLKLTQAQNVEIASKVDDAVARSHSFLDYILQYDVSWRTSVFRGETEYDQKIQDRIEEGLRRWAKATEYLISNLDKLRQNWVCPESLETLRPRLDEVRSMLAPDDEFFEGEALDDLAAKAVTEHESGSTVEFLVMGE